MIRSLIARLLWPDQRRAGPRRLPALSDGVCWASCGPERGGRIRGTIDTPRHGLRCSTRNGTTFEFQPVVAAGRQCEVVGIGGNRWEWRTGSNLARRTPAHFGREREAARLR